MSTSPKWDYNCRQFRDFNEEDINSSGDSFFVAADKTPNKYSSFEYQELLKSAKRLYDEDRGYLEDESLDTSKQADSFQPTETSSLIHTQNNSRSFQGDSTSHLPENDYSISSHFSPNHRSSPITGVARRNSGIGLSKKKRTDPAFLKALVQRLTKTTKSLAAATAAAGTASKDFWATLRQNEPPKAFQPKVTRPVPFNLTENKKRKWVSSESCHTMAEQVLAFEKGIKRPKLSPAPSRNKGPKALTVPKTPRLLTKTRVRNHKILSQQEKEEQFLQEIRKNQFKAQPVDPRIYMTCSGLPKIEPRPITRPRTPKLATAERFAQRACTSLQVSSQPYQFKAQPIPPGILDKEETSVKSRYMQTNTKSSALHSSLPSKEEFVFKAAPVPDFSHIFQPKCEKKHLTRPSPFTFDLADQERRAKKEARIAQLKNEENKAQQFVAQPVPDFSRAFFPKKVDIPLTEPIPFNFHTEFRIRSNQQEDSDEEEGLRFFPKLKRPLADITQLHTEQRALERQRQKAAQEEKARVHAEELKMQERAKHLVEQQELAHLRQSLVHNPRPVPKFPPPDPPSKHVPVRPITSPHTPFLLTRERARN